MENQYSNNTLHNNSYAGYETVLQLPNVHYILFWIITSICLPLTILAIYALYSLVRHDHTFPIYIINLFISDLIQLCGCSMMLYGKPMIRWGAKFMHNTGVMASVGFMVCISLERYLVIAWPLWYRFRRTIKGSVVVCVIVWVLPLLFLGLFQYIIHSGVVLSVFFLLPFPVFIFSLVGTFKALSAAISVTTQEKRRIVGVLILVLLNYILLFLPLALSLILFIDSTFNFVSQCLFQFSPLANLVLYVFMRKDAINKPLASLCCCTMDKQSENVGVKGENEERNTDK